MEEGLAPSLPVAPPAVRRDPRPGSTRAVRRRGLERRPRVATRARAGHRTALGRATFAFLLTIATTATFGATFLSAFATSFSGRALPNVRVAGVDVAGLDRREAEALVRSSIPSLSAGRLTLVWGRHRTTIGYDTFERDYQMAAMLDAAFAVGHSGDAIAQALDGLRSMLKPTDIAPQHSVDSDAVRTTITQALVGVARSPSDAEVTFAADASGWTVTPSLSGRSLDLRPIVAEVATALDSLDPSDLVIHIRTRHIRPTYTTGEAQAAVDYARKRTDIGLSLAGQDLAFPITPETLRTWYVVDKTPQGGFGVTFHEELARKAVADLADDIHIAPADARLERAGTTIVGYVPSREGRQLDVEKTLANVLAALDAPAPADGAKPVALAIQALHPSFTSAEAAGMVGPLVKLSAWTTPYVPSERNYYGRNISTPTSALDGYVINPGDSFSFWRGVGEVSPATGYGPGGVIRNGHTEPTGALAGGICSCSTTLFNAAARAGLEILERHNHYYYIDRYPVGLDATVLKGSSGPIQDMRFRNDTDSPILIRGVNSPGKVTFELYGVPDGRTVSFSTPVIKNRAPARTVYWYTSNLPTGVTRRYEYPADGFDSWVTRTVRDRNGRVIHQETFYSHYARVDGVILIGR